MCASARRRSYTAAAPIAASFGQSGSAWTASTYGNVVTVAHHLLGAHDAELATARTVRARHPDDRRGLALELRALIALGDVPRSGAGSHADPALAPPRPHHDFAALARPRG